MLQLQPLVAHLQDLILLKEFRVLNLEANIFFLQLLHYLLDVYDLLDVPFELLPIGLLPLFQHLFVFPLRTLPFL